MRWISAIWTLVLPLLLFAEQGKVYQYSANTGITPFMDHCYFLVDSKYCELGVPPTDVEFTHSSDVDFSQMPSKYWIRFTIHNTEDHREKIQLFIGLSEYLEFYIPKDNGYEKYSIGNFQSRKDANKISGEGKTFLCQAMIQLETDETATYYACFNRLSGGQQAERDAQLEPRLISAEQWIETNQLSTRIWNFIFGCFLILILYHIVFYFITWDRTYLFYCLFVFAVSFPFVTLIYDVYDMPKYNANLFFGVSGLFSVFYFQFTRDLINLKKLLPRWDKFLKYVIWIKVLIVVSYTIGHLIFTNIFIILSLYIPSLLIELAIMVVLVFALIRSKDRISILFALGSVMAWAVMFIAVGNADPENSFTPQLRPYKFATPAYGFILESLFFAMVLSYRSRLNEIEKKEAKDALINQLQENKELQEKVNRELEEKVVERTREIAEEKQKTEDLLLNVLPKSVVSEMKATGRTTPRHFDNTSVLFADFVGFTRISSQMTPEELVEHLDYFFKNFDAIMKKYGLEKIKTIGDAYLSVCGVPDPVPSHAEKTVLAALDMQAFMANYKEEHPEEDWNMRIGIHSGKVVAGVIGNYKFSYDIWGDTVNTAARMEENSSPGKVNVSEAVYEQTKDRFNFTKRGLVEAKNKGMIHMYFVEGLVSAE